MRILTGAVLALLALVLLAGCGGGGSKTVTPPPTPPPAFGATGSVEGYVYLETSGMSRTASRRLILSSKARVDVPAATGAVVSVRGQHVSTTIGSNPRFQLDGVLCGSQVVVVTLDGYAQTTGTVTVAENTVVKVSDDFQLQPATLNWVVMVYMAADNSLSSPTSGYCDLSDINEMEYGEYAYGTGEAVGTVKTLVLRDGPATDDCALYEIAPDSNNSPNPPSNPIVSPAVKTYAELDTSNYLTLRTFISECQTRYPAAEHYLLVLWNHGSGWSAGTDIPSRGIAEDKHPGANPGNTWMANVDVAKALQLQARPIDVLVADACLMGMAEVAYEWRQGARYLVASEEETALEGMPYDKLMQRLYTPSLAASPESIARNLSQDAFDRWTANYAYGETPEPVSSVIDLSRMSEVALTLNAFAARLTQVGNQYVTQLGGAFFGVQRFDIYFGGYFADLWDYADEVQGRVPDAQLAAYAGYLKTAVSNAVIAEHHADTRPGAHGMSIYLKNGSTFRLSDYNLYKDIALSKDTAWESWLAAQPAY